MKAILVIDMPEECLLCPCYCHSEEFDNEFCKVNLQAFMSAEERDNRPEWCPLKPMPQKKILDEELFMSGNFRLIQARFTGWNDCIDEIIGGKNEEIDIKKEADSF